MRDVGSMWRRRTAPTLPAGALLVIAGRIFCEAVQWPYHWAPVPWFCACLCLLRGRVAAVVALMLYAITVSELYPPPFLSGLLPTESPWWWTFGMGAVAACTSVGVHELLRAPIVRTA